MKPTRRFKATESDREKSLSHGIPVKTTIRRDCGRVEAPYRRGLSQGEGGPRGDSRQGDLSENAGYREARRNQAKTISRIRFLQKVLEHSRVIDPDALPKDRVCLLSKVEFTNLATNTRMKFEIVSPHEMNLEAGKISLKSPIGAALTGKKVGEIAEAQVPSGTLRLRIESITID